MLFTIRAPPEFVVRGTCPAMLSEILRSGQLSTYGRDEMFPPTFDEHSRQAEREIESDDTLALPHDPLAQVLQNSIAVRIGVEKMISPSAFVYVKMTALHRSDGYPNLPSSIPCPAEVDANGASFRVVPTDHRNVLIRFWNAR